ncbi:MAG: 50S ribosomal protein L4 [Ignavibacteriales bacterium]|nr:50S ribosomal protein L4 [Ignavibacteriales bacterium]
MKLDVVKIDGAKSGTSIDLPEEIFGVEPNDHALYLAVKAHMANRRQGTHKAKERSEVRGGGRKPWRQKGRGAARVGTIRSPLWIGGGTIFGPRPRSYRQKLNKKLKRLARLSAFSLKAKEEKIVVVENFSFDEPKTKQVVEMFDALSLTGTKTLLLTAEHDANVYKSARNLPKTATLAAKDVSTYDILNHETLVMQQGAAEAIIRQFTEEKATA